MANETPSNQTIRVSGPQPRAAVSPIITTGLNTEFNRLRRQANRHKVDITELPENIQREMRRRAQTGTVSERVADTFFSPFRQRTTIEAPTEHKERIDWYRFWAARHELVGRACELHAYFPLSNFMIDHEDPEIEQWCNDMVEDEELDLFNFILMMGMEYWIVGEAFPFGMFDNAEDPHEWDKFILLDPKNVAINYHRMIRGPSAYNLSWKPDADLKKIVDNGPDNATTGPLYNALPPDIIEATVKDTAIPLHPLQVSHFKRTVNPFAVRGESIISRIMHILMYEAKLQDAQFAVADRHVCYDHETECLTRDGWKCYYDLTKEDYIGTVNKDTGAFEWQRPVDIYVSYYEGEMIQFGGGPKDKKIDILVTPNHRMLVQEYSYLRTKGYSRQLGRSLGEYGYTGEWCVVRADNVRPKSRFRGVIDDYAGENVADTIEVGDESYNIDDYLMMVGWYLSEGTLHCHNDRSICVSISQTTRSSHIKNFDRLFKKLGFRHSTNNQGTRICSKSGKAFGTHFLSNFGALSNEKHIPSWIKNLGKDKLRILLDALVMGDGHKATCTTYKGKKYKRCYIQYYTVSEQLADDVQEIAFKMGYAPVLRKDRQLKRRSQQYGYTVQWSETSDLGKFPMVGVTRATVSKTVDYKGNIWCVMVPNGFFVTRRNGKITVQSNSPKEFYLIGDAEEPADEAELQNFQEILTNNWAAPNQAIIYHHALQIQWEGANGRVLALTPEFQDIRIRLLSGLGISEAFLSGQGPTFANASVSLEVQIAMYITYRQQIEKWLLRHFFKPLFEIHGIYKPSQAELSHKLRIRRKKRPWLPSITWDKAQLRDEQTRISLYQQLVESGILPIDMLYEQLNLRPKEIKRKLQEQAREQQTGQIPPGTLPSPGGLGLPPVEPGPGIGLPSGLPPLPPAGLEGGGENPPPMGAPTGPTGTVPAESFRGINLPTGV